MNGSTEWKINDQLSFTSPCPVKKYYHDIIYENFFIKICKSIDEGFIVCSDTCTSPKISSHAFRVIGHGEIKDSTGKPYNLFKINFILL